MIVPEFSPQSNFFYDFNPDFTDYYIRRKGRYFSNLEFVFTKSVEVIEVDEDDHDPGQDDYE